MDDPVSPHDEPRPQPASSGGHSAGDVPLEEGLGLLATVRTITDSDVRRQFLAMVRTIALAAP